MMFKILTSYYSFSIQLKEEKEKGECWQCFELRTYRSERGIQTTVLYTHFVEDKYICLLFKHSLV